MLYKEKYHIFDKLDENNFTKAFRNFEALREEFSNQLAASNPNSNGGFINDTIKLDNFNFGYGPYSQDVLIPAFIAAYTGKDVSKEILPRLVHNTLL